MNTYLTKFTKYILDIMFLSGIFVLITLPFSLKFLGRHYSSTITDHFLFMLVIFAVSGICGLLIIYELRKMMHTVLHESCFVYENVKSLNHMSITSLCIIVMFILKLIFLPTPATAVLFLLSLSPHYSVGFWHTYLPRQSVIRKKMILRYRRCQHGN